MSGLVPVAPVNAAVTDTDAQTSVLAVTVTAGDILVVHFAGRDATLPGAPTVTHDAGAAFSSAANVGTGVNGSLGGGTTQRQHIIYYLVNTGGTYNVTADWGSTILTLGKAYLRIPGANTNSPFGAQTAVNATGGASTTPACGTMSAIASTSNTKILFITSQQVGDGCAPEAGWTELYDKGSAAENLHMAAYYLTDASADDTTPTATLTQSVKWKASGVEVSAAPAAGQQATSSTRRRLAIRRRRS